MIQTAPRSFCSFRIVRTCLAPLGADYVFAGNIYETECKAGLAGRGLAFLKEVCDNTCLPVYAIGGMTPDRLPDVLEAGAKGACMMSGFMKL